MLAIRSALLVAVMTGTLAWPALVHAADPVTETVELKKGDHIIFFGDSLTELAGKEAPKRSEERRVGKECRL